MNKKVVVWNIIYPFVSLAFIIAIWAITAATINEEIIVPSIADTFNRLIIIFQDSKFFLRVGNTLLKCIIAFGISFLIAAFTVFVSKLCKPVKDILSVFILLLRSIPTMSFILLALMWLTSFKAPILVACIVLYPIMYTGLMNAVDGVDSKLCVMAKAYKVPMKKQITNLYLPEMKDGIFSVIRTTLSFSVKIVIAAEVLAQTKNSIGVAMNNARLYLETGDLFAWTIVAIVLGALLEGIVVLIMMITDKCMR